jgi:hypothetical protein
MSLIGVEGFKIYGKRSSKMVLKKLNEDLLFSIK